MLIKTEEVLIKAKGRKQGHSNKTGNDYDLPQIMVQAKDNCNYTITLPNEFLYTLATENEKAIITYYLDTQGNISINNIERCK